MRTLIHHAVSAALLVLLYLGGAHACPDLLVALGLDFHDLPHYQKIIREQSQRTEVLAEFGKQVAGRTAAKDALARDLAAGKLTVVQAAAAFRALPGLDRDYWELALCVVDGASHDERLCRYAIGWIEYLMCRESEDALTAEGVAILARLEQELQAHLEQHGGQVQLP